MFYAPIAAVKIKRVGKVFVRGALTPRSAHPASFPPHYPAPHSAARGVGRSAAKRISHRSQRKRSAAGPGAPSNKCGARRGPPPREPPPPVGRRAAGSGPSGARGGRFRLRTARSAGGAARFPPARSRRGATGGGCPRSPRSASPRPRSGLGGRHPQPLHSLVRWKRSGNGVCGRGGRGGDTNTKEFQVANKYILRPPIGSRGGGEPAPAVNFHLANPASPPLAGPAAATAPSRPRPRPRPRRTARSAGQGPGRGSGGAGAARRKFRGASDSRPAAASHARLPPRGRAAGRRRSAAPAQRAALFSLPVC